MQALPSETAPTAPLLRMSIVLSGLTGAAGVAFLALSAHADTTGFLKTAAQMLLFHAPALLAMGVLAQVRRAPVLPAAFLMMAAGLFLFCGDLIARALINARLFPMAAPTGGMLIILSWLVLALSAIRVRAR